MSQRELPLRIIVDDGGTPVIRCLCGAEAAAVIQPGRSLRPDLSPAIITRMILHARRCTLRQEALETVHR